MPHSLSRRTFLKHVSLAAGGAATMSTWRITPARGAAGDPVIHTHVIRRIGDLELRADVIRPDDKTVRPVLMWIHGGALIVGNRQQVDRRLKRAFLDAGYAIVSIDYRLAPETKLPHILEDVDAAYGWLREQGGGLFSVDTRNVAVAGGSAGGYLTLATGFRCQPKPAALVSLWGYGDLTGKWYSEPDAFYRKQPLVKRDDALAAVGSQPLVDGNMQGQNRGRFYLYCRQNGLWPKEVSGYDPHTESSAYDAFSPVRNVTSDYPPTLLMHGTEDTDVPYEQSVLMAKQFEQHGVEHKFLTVEGAGHGLSGGDPEKIANAYAEVVPFVDKYIKSV